MKSGARQVDDAVVLKLNSLATAMIKEKDLPEADYSISTCLECGRYGLWNTHLKGIHKTECLRCNKQTNHKFFKWTQS